MSFKYCHKCLRLTALSIFVLAVMAASVMSPETTTAVGSSVADAPAVLAHVAP